jgi:hypothetical protein
MICTLKSGSFGTGNIIPDPDLAVQIGYGPDRIWIH